MESCSLHSSTMATVSTHFTTSGNADRNTVLGQALRFPSLSNYCLGRKLKIPDAKAPASVTAKASSQSVGTIIGDEGAKDENLAFVAGATGRVGSRTVRELLKLGFQVRASVRTARRAGSLVESVKQMKLEVEGPQRKKMKHSLPLVDYIRHNVPAVERLEIVECDLEKPNQIGPALGNASVVLCCIGASEKEVFDVTGPFRIDYMATKNLIDASRVAKVKHFIMVSSLGTNKIGFPAAILNLFWGVLIWKRKAEEAIIASGVPYTIVRPGGMERPTDAYKETHNLLLSEEDTLFGGQVSNLQIAELIAFMAKNRRLSYCKVVEAIAETTAPLTPINKLLEKIPSQRVLPQEFDTIDQPEPAASPAEAVLSKPDDTSGTQISSAELVPAAAEIQPAAKISRPLSPYTAYEDLKPPSSPSPTASGPKAASSSAQPAAETASLNVGSDGLAEKTTSVDADNSTPPQASKNGNSPYQVYEDLKPPTTPTPTAPNGAPILSASSANRGPQVENSTLPAPTGTEKPPQNEPKPRPLSPYTMYEDMKPPSTPSPSPK